MTGWGKWEDGGRRFNFLIKKNMLSSIKPHLRLEDIIQKKEDTHVERKSFWITPSKLANSIIWMANAEWGIIFLGIYEWILENWEIIDPIKLNNFRQIGIDFISPPCNLKIEEVYIGEKLVFIYHIEPDYERLFLRKDTEDVYLRVWDETRKLDRGEVEKLQYDKSIRKYEDEIVPDFDENDLRKSVCEYYQKKLSYEWDFRDLLVNRYLAVFRDGKYLYRNSAILLFAEDPEKYIPSASARYIRYDGTSMQTGTALNIIKDERFIWSIPWIIELLRVFFKNVLRDYYFLDLHEGKFRKISEYPEEAWLESIVNALTHRSYNLHGNVTLIKHFDDRLEISNSWPLPSFVTPENIKTHRYARNPRIARILNDFWYVRELNEWVKRIFESMQRYLMTEPIYTNENKIVTLVLKNNTFSDNRVISEQKRLRVEKDFNNLSETGKAIIVLLSQHNWLTRSKIGELLSTPDSTLRYNLTKLIDIGLIERHGKWQRDANALYTL